MDKQIDKNRLRREKRRRIFRLVAVGAVLAALAVLAVTLTGRSIDRRDISVGTVDSGPLNITVPASGRVVPSYEEIIVSPVDSRLLRVFAQAGDSVRRDQPLLELDLRQEETEYEKLQDRRRMSHQELTQLRLTHRTLLSDLEMQIQVAEMEVNRLRTETENERRLDSIGSGTGDRVRQAETAWQTALLQLRQLRVKLANERSRTAAAEDVRSLEVGSIDRDLDLARGTLRQGRVPAPLDGVLTYIISDLGSRVSAGQKVAVVADLSQFRIEAEVPEGSSNRVAVGSEVSVRIGGGTLEGKVTNITPQSKQGTVSFMVRPDNPRDPRLRSGLRAELAVAYGYKDRVTRIPVGKFFKGPGEYKLFVMDGDDRLERRTVTLGDSNRNYAEVISGLSPGQRVVISDMSDHIKYKSLKIK